MLTAGEIAARQTYWRFPKLVDRVVRVRRRWIASSRASIELAALEDRLRSIVEVASPPLVIVHSSMDALALRVPGAATPPDVMSTAVALLALLKRLIGAEGTLAMPTHPTYPGDDDPLADKSGWILDYDPRRTLSRVGLLTEIFRRSRGTQRSLHPLSSLACQGPLAEELLRDNLNDRRPLPHGVDSGYHRICQLGGLVVSIGRPLHKCVTIFHAAEDGADADWQVPRFFRERLFRVAGTRPEPWIVRERRPEFVRCLAAARMRRDWLREGILHESSVGGVRVDWASAREIFDFLTSRRSSAYPYLLTRWAGV